MIITPTMLLLWLGFSGSALLILGFIAGMLVERVKFDRGQEG